MSKKIRISERFADELHKLSLNHPVDFYGVFGNVVVNEEDGIFYFISKSPNSKRFELEQRKTEALELIGDKLTINGTTIDVGSIKSSLSEDDIRKIVREEIKLQDLLDKGWVAQENGSLTYRSK